LISAGVVLEKGDQGGVDRIGAFLLNPGPAPPMMMSFCRKFGSTRSISATRLAPIRPVPIRSAAAGKTRVVCDTSSC
jgi:hypothetical protein